MGFILKEVIKMPKCKCSCGETVRGYAGNTAKIKEYVSGHNNTGPKKVFQYSKLKNRWLVRGRSYLEKSYWANIVYQNYCNEGKPLPRGSIVHHINNDTADDRPENLRILTKAEHIKLHQPTRGVKVVLTKDCAVVVLDSLAEAARFKMGKNGWQVNCLNEGGYYGR